MASDRIKTCFISAPATADVRPIAEALIQRRVKVLGLSESSAGTSWQASIAASIAQADLLIGVLTHSDISNTIFELGLAVGYGKPLLIFAPAKGGVLPASLQGFQIVRTSLQNREAIDFALDQILASPLGPIRLDQSSRPAPLARTIETRFYRNRLSQLMHDGQFRELERLVATVLRESSAEVVAEAPSPGRGIDLVVWSDGLQSYVDNPFPIEIKARLRSREDVKRALGQTEKAAHTIGSRWSMLLYGEGPSQDDRVWRSNPAVLALKIDHLFAQLEYVTFPEIVRSLRNHRVHGLEH